MIKKKASEIFGEVDPNLRVINGGVHYSERKPRVVTFEDWERVGGIRCSGCGDEVVRLIDGLCLQCHGEAEAERAKKAGEKSERRYFKNQLRKGTISLAQMREGRLGS